MKSKFLDIYNIIMEQFSANEIDASQLLNNIKSILNSNNIRLNEDILKRIYSLSKRLVSNSDPIELLSSSLKTYINLPESVSNDIAEALSNLVEDETLLKLNQYISNEDQRLNINDYLGQKIDIDTIMMNTGLPESSVIKNYLLNKVASHQVNMGRGEIFSSIIFKFGKKDFKQKGDVQIGSKELEVKGLNARLGGQKGFGDQESVPESFKNDFIKYIKDDEFKLNIRNIENKDFNFGKRNIESNNKFILLCNAIKSKNPNFSLEEVREIFKNGFEKLYKLKDIDIDFDKAINESDGKFYINSDLFYKRFLRFSFLYYMNIEKFDYFMILNNSEMLILNEDMIKTLDLTEFINLKTLPSFSGKSGAQGKLVQIDLK